MKTKTLAIDLLRIDGDTQSRVSINQDAVDDYAEVIGESNGDWPFPPLDVFHDGAEYFVADGFHRYHGAQQCKRGSVPCRVHNGTALDAAIFAMTANDKHGMRLTRADKRRCVERLLDGKKRTQKEIAELAGVSKRLVQIIVSERNPASIAGKAQISPQPTSSGVSSDATAPAGAVPTGTGDPPVETAGPSPASKAKKPPKKFDRSYWLKQWEQQIGPIVRLVDKIANELEEAQCNAHVATLDHLQYATDEMSEWMAK